MEKIYEAFAALPLNILRTLYCVGKSFFELIDENNSIKIYLQKGLNLLKDYSERKNIELYSNVLRESTKEIIENEIAAYEVDYETLRGPDYDDLIRILKAIRKKVSKQPIFEGVEGADSVSIEDSEEEYNDSVDDQKEYTDNKGQYIEINITNLGDEEKDTEISEDQKQYIEYNEENQEEKERLQLFFILDRIVTEIVAESSCKDHPKTCYQFAITTYLCGDPDSEVYSQISN